MLNSVSNKKKQVRELQNMVDNDGNEEEMKEH